MWLLCFLWSFCGNLSSFLSLCGPFIWFWVDIVSSYGHFVSLWGSFVSYWASLWSYLSCCGSLWSFLCTYCVFLRSFCVVLVILWLFMVNDCLFVAILTLKRENIAFKWGPDLLGTCSSLQRSIHDETSWQRHVSAHSLWYLCTWKHVYKELTTWNGLCVQRSSRRGYKHVFSVHHLNAAQTVVLTLEPLAPSPLNYAQLSLLKYIFFQLSFVASNGRKFP